MTSMYRESDADLDFLMRPSYKGFRDPRWLAILIPGAIWTLGLAFISFTTERPFEHFGFWGLLMGICALIAVGIFGHRFCVRSDREFAATGRLIADARAFVRKLEKTRYNPATWHIPTKKTIH